MAAMAMAQNPCSPSESLTVAPRVMGQELPVLPALGLHPLPWGDLLLPAVMGNQGHFCGMISSNFGYICNTDPKPTVCRPIKGFPVGR